MDATLNPVEMIEPGSGRRCVVQGKDEADFLKAGYRRADQMHVEPEAPGAGEAEEAEPAEASSESEDDAASVEDEAEEKPKAKRGK